MAIEIGEAIVGALRGEVVATVANAPVLLCSSCLFVKHAGSKCCNWVLICCDELFCIRGMGGGCVDSWKHSHHWPCLALPQLILCLLQSLQLSSPKTFNSNVQGKLYTRIYYSREPAGNLTSRLGADCQRLSHIISNNIHLIVQNSIQDVTLGIGALINLLTLSWPLALSACFICTLLCMIFLVYGRLMAAVGVFVAMFVALCLTSCTVVS